MKLPPLLFKETPWQTLVRHLYSFLMCLFAPFLLLILLWKERNEGWYAWRAFAQRCGLSLTLSGAKKKLWFHCASVGEVTVAATIINALRKENSSLTMVVTTTTITGAKRAKQLLGEDVSHCFLCIDIPFVIERFLAHWQPSALIITEVELWPNIIHSCWKQQRPVILINGRLSERSAARYASASALSFPMFKKITAVGTQSHIGMASYCHVGVAEKRIIYTGNIKFEQAMTMAAQVRECALPLSPDENTLFLLGASTHAPEEALLTRAFLRIRKTIVNSKLILVPRYPQRCNEVTELLKASGLNIVTSSSATDVLSSDHDVLLVDEMGRLAECYLTADIAFVGGSIATRGGHNALEAAVYSVPVVMGPSRFNNAQICELLTDVGAMQLATDEDSLVQALENWINNKAIRIEAGSAARQLVERNLGALEATLTIIKDAMHRESAD